jgi:hypothetical protein
MRVAGMTPTFVVDELIVLVAADFRRLLVGEDDAFVLQGSSNGSFNPKTAFLVEEF